MNDTQIANVFLHGYTGDKFGIFPFAEATGLPGRVLIDLPGFGTSQDPPLAAQKDIVAYAEHVLSVIKNETQSTQFNLIGHSHGAMVAFAIAALHPELVNKLVLVCPVARPRLTTRLFVALLQGATNLFGPNRIHKVAANQRFVDMVSRYLMNKHWSPEARGRIMAMRRREAHSYRAVALNMLRQTGHFPKQFADTKLQVPTVICWAVDDKVSGANDLNWYNERLANATCVKVQGGHLAPCADPADVAQKITPLLNAS